jgi:hypothetical protein
MCADGFFVAGFDGTAVQGGRWNGLPKPFELRGRRPDAWGAAATGSLIAFAEAKTASDILSARSIAQLCTFGAVRMKLGSLPCPLYVAVPREHASTLDKALTKAHLLGAIHIVRLHVPEALLRENRHAA